MILAGFDISTNKTGISCFDDGKLIKYKLIDHHKISDTTNRMVAMSKSLIDSLDTINPKVVYCEDTWMNNNPETICKLTMLLGVVYCWCIMHDAKFEKIKPASWRSCLGFKLNKAKRDELKRQSMDYVKSKYGLEVGDDEADAICIGCAALIKEAEK